MKIDYTGKTIVVTGTAQGTSAVAAASLVETSRTSGPEASAPAETSRSSTILTARTPRLLSPAARPGGVLKLRRARRLICFALPQSSSKEERPEAQPPTPDGPRP